MPLALITTQKDRFPADRPEDDTPLQDLTARLGAALPHMLHDHKDVLHLGNIDPNDVRVSFVCDHPRVINGDVIWIQLTFYGTAPAHKSQQKMRQHVQRQVLGWIDAQTTTTGEVNVCVDIFWVTGRGFSRKDGKIKKW